MTAPTGLAKKSIGTFSLFWFLVGASAPMTVLAGGLIATFAPDRCGRPPRWHSSA